MLELNNMRQSLKHNYFEEILLYDDKVSRTMADTHAKVLKSHMDQAKY
jgi:hypothetical protein